VPKASAPLAEANPGLKLSLYDRHPVDALQLLQHGEIDVALISQYADAPVEDDGVHLVHIGDDPIYLVSQRPDDSIANHRHSAWIGGCERCTDELTTICRQKGFTPRIASFSDDTSPRRRQRRHDASARPRAPTHHRPDVHTTELTSSPRQIRAATYGEPPDPPAVAAVVEALTETARSTTPSATT